MISEQDYRKWVLILLALIAIFLLIFIIGVIYSAVNISRTVGKLNNITSTIEDGIQNIKEDLNDVGQDIIQALPRFFNWLLGR